MPAHLSDQLRSDPLLLMAQAAREHAYAPHSQFRVGAALLTRDGRRYSGCNIENSSYGLCNCAERTALFTAIADGCKPGDFARMAIIGDTPDQPISPCGACRQVMAELCDPHMPVLLANLQGLVHETTIEILLPLAFRLLRTV